MLVEPVVENADMLVVTVERSGSLLESYIGTSKPSSSCEIFLCSCGASYFLATVSVGFFIVIFFIQSNNFCLFLLYMIDISWPHFFSDAPTYLFFSRKRAASTYWTWVFTACVQWQDMKPILGRPPRSLWSSLAHSFSTSLYLVNIYSLNVVLSWRNPACC